MEIFSVQGWDLLLRWIHFLAGITWIGLLYYFNFVQGEWFKETDASGPPTVGGPGTDERGTIQQGYIELSNVQVVEEMVNLISAQRAYETNSRTVQTADEMLQTANNMKR